MAILESKQISLKMKLPTNYVCKQTTDVKLLLLHSNIETI